MMKVAIIGGGIAGYHTLKYLTKNKQFKKISVTMYDHESRLGKGVAFQQDDEELLLNYPANYISLKKNDDRDFYNWVMKHGDETLVDEQVEDNQDEEGNLYFSRQLFGGYLHDRLTKLIDKYDVKTVTEQVDTVRRGKKKWHVTAGENVEKYDHLFIATGILPPVDHYELDGTKGFYHPTYPLQHIEVDQTKDYAVIGTGLSGLDCIRYLLDHGVKHITAVSRNGQVQSVRGKMRTFDFEYFTAETFEHIRRDNHDLIPLDALIDVFNKECRHQKINVKKLTKVNRSNPIEAMKHDIEAFGELGELQAILYEMQHLGAHIWPFMSASDKARFLSEVEPFIKENTNPMPEPSALELLDAIEQGRVEIKGGLEAVEYKYRKFRLQYDNGEEDRVHYVINATGPGKQITQQAGAMLNTLLDEGYIMHHEDGGISVMPLTNKVISPKYGVMDDLRVMGYLTGGVNYGNNGIHELLVEAERVVKLFYKEIN